MTHPKPRRRLLPWLAWAALLLSSCATLPHSAWPEWDGFSERFMQRDGRIVDHTFGGKSTSEGQSYGMFFALVANRRADFERILSWTSDNLAGGALGQRLPAWHWGQREDGSWGVKDENSASDSDLWIAYCLLEAGRLWKEPRYEHMGRQLLEQVKTRSVVYTQDGPLLLPGPHGFALEGERYRINPSYLPGFMFAYLAGVDPQGPWTELWQRFIRQSRDFAPQGLAPNLYVVDALGTVMGDTQEAPLGSYDAIRVYLWAGMSGSNSAVLRARFVPYAQMTRALGAPPEKIDPVSGQALPGDFSPPGFAGALLPFFKALGDEPTYQQLLQHLQQQRSKAKVAGNSAYYDEALALFGLGWSQGQYRFDDSGRLQARWTGG